MSLYIGHNRPGTGRIRTIRGTDPAAGNQIVETVPTGRIWRFISLEAAYTTSAVVANRQVIWFIRDNAGRDVYFDIASAAQTASLAQNYLVAEIGHHVTFNLNIVHTFPLPIDLFCLGAWSLQSFVINSDPGDDWNAPDYVIEEWWE